MEHGPPDLPHVPSDSQNLTVGAIAATIQGVSLQPTLYWKNAAARGRPFTLNPAIIYRGTYASIGNEVVQLCGQMLFAGMSRRWFSDAPGSVGRQWVGVVTLASASIGGAVTALVASPVELIMIQQQFHGGGPWATLRNVVRAQKVHRGLLACVARDAIYVLGMLGISPLLDEHLRKGWLAQQPRIMSSLGASVTGGILATLLSQPYDNVKTCLQADLAGQQYGHHLLSAASRIIHERGIHGLFKGAIWRGVNIICTVFIVAETSRRVPPILFPATLPAARGPQASSGSGDDAGH